MKLEWIQVLSYKPPQLHCFRVQIFSDIGAETSKLHAMEGKNSMGAKLIDILVVEIFKAIVAAVFKPALTGAYKHGKRILYRLMGRSDNEVDEGLENNYERLMELAEELFPIRDDILDQTKTKLVTLECEDWISRVKKLEEEVQELEIKYKRQSQQGSSKSSTILRKSMKKKCKELHRWLKEEPRIRILAEKLPEQVIFMPKSKREDEQFLNPIVEKILGYLRDETVKKFGLYGDPKIGKTTIMQDLNNNEDIGRTFDIVIWVTVSEDFGFEKLQHKMADRLKLDLEGITDQFEIFNKICQRLKGKRYLLLLDEVPGSLDSKLISLYGHENDSKVVLTTKTRYDCLELEVEPLIHVGPMSRAVAWKIFQEKVGQNVNLPLVRPIAELVAEECAGLPSVIEKVASKFRRRDSYDLWMEGYKILQSWSVVDIQDLDELL